MSDNSDLTETDLKTICKSLKYSIIVLNDVSEFEKTLAKVERMR